MDKIHDGHRQRLRERIQINGFCNLNEHEKLEALLFAYIPRRNTNDIAHDLIIKFGSLAKVLDARECDLIKVKGMTANAALYLSMLPNIVESYRESKQNTLQSINNSSNAIEYFKIHIGMRTTEVMQILCLNVKRQLEHIITTESKNSSSITYSLCDLISEIVRHNAKHVIIGHNHPSGDVTPSKQDLDFVSNMIASLRVLGIELVDNIIVGHENSLSFRDSLLFCENRLPKEATLEKAASAFFGWGKNKAGLTD